MKRFEASLHSRKDGAGFVNLDVANTLFNIAFLHQNRGKIKKAVKCMNEALKIRKLLSPDTERVAFTYHKIGTLYVMLGQHRRARTSFESALRIRMDLFGDDHPSLASVHQDLGNLLDSLGDFDAAIEHFEQCLAVREQQKDYEEVASTLYSIGFTLHNKNDNDGAIKYLNKCLDLRREKNGNLAEEVGDTLNMIGYLEAHRGNSTKSLVLLTEALRIRRTRKDRLKTSDTLKNIGNVRREQGEYDKALRNYEECLALRRKELGEEDEKVASALIAVGNVRSDKGEPDSALAKYQEALVIRLAVFGATHEKVAEILLTMGTAEYRGERKMSALKYLENFVSIKNHNKDKDGDYVNAVFSLGTLYKENGQEIEARRSFNQAYTAVKQLGLSARDPKVLKIMEQLLRSSVRHLSSKNPQLWANANSAERTESVILDGATTTDPSEDTEAESTDD
eukprot:CAMPEP_0118703848 /NCGR_PEP_ID=MMETSP0800-20121206/18844_1 /TAXON_ID=210618 ORGANISM="Striatella unipunctata, Strain CCMP2910" /NCGR_SAMPLE_ID=MMETSP0800 /ASSEMBLY_ACC=CAM_ASM_000638 /LENGTH=451 /DNA_ID=CAMNT_0006605545 /DNA_START=687 /DNA_END=2042 /DNA_ORIENTATION=-